MEVSVITTIRNGEKWINRCFEAIHKQTAIGVIPFEICVCDDGSTDETSSLLLAWQERFAHHKIELKVTKNEFSKGVGSGKNKAVEISSGKYLCFQDVDDVMLPERIRLQYETAEKLDDSYLIGSKFTREPKDATLRFTKWANNLTNYQLQVQAYMSHGPTVIMPTWFCHKNIFDRVKGFSEGGKGTPEDLIFFYMHLDNGGKVFRVDETLLIYQYHLGATTFSIDEQTIWKLRIERLENTLLTHWTDFTIWNAGKQGRKFYNSLAEDVRSKVKCFCDVDAKKIGKTYTPYDPVKRKAGRPLNIVHFTAATPPFVICLKLDMTDGAFEANLASLNLRENDDFVLFN